MRWFIAGLGYTAHYLALQLRTRGAEIVGCARAPHQHRWRDLGVEAFASDMSRLADAQLRCDVAVIFVPPSKPLALAETQMAQRLVAAGCTQLLYVSSTGVYGAADGAFIGETWPTAPTSSAGQARLAVEQALRATFADLAATPYAAASHASANASAPPPRLAIARVAGIYGPGRYPWDKVRDGTYRLIEGGTSAVSRIHVEDLARALVLLAHHKGDGVFNVADDDPASMKELADAVRAAEPACPAPPLLGAGDVTPEVAAMLLADRRVDASKLKAATGWTPRFASWRDAYATATMSP